MDKTKGVPDELRKNIGSFGTRRDVLSALTGGVLMAAPDRASGSVRRRVGIVGGGMAGVSLAWLLNGQRDVVLMESRSSLGGNVQTVQVELGGKTLAVDMGAQYFHPKLYPTYVRLLTKLGLYPPLLQEAHSFPASISMYVESEPFPRFVSPQLWDRLWPVFAPWNWEGLTAFGTGFGAAKTQEDQRADWNVTLEAWLQTLGLPRKQWEGMLLPWAASLFTGRTEQARGYSARAAMIFAATSVPENALEPVLSYVLNRGMAEAIRRMVKQMQTVEVLTGAEVKQIIRQQGEFVLVCSDGRRRQVDDLVLASSGPSSLRLLEGLPGTRAQQTALAGIEFEDTRIAVHSDPAYAPQDPNHWSFLNCQMHAQYCEASMWLTKVLPAAPASQPQVQLWKSWVTHRDRGPRNILRESSFRHMVPSVASLRAQARVLELQGDDGVWIAGGYTYPFDCQETALVSAVKVAMGLKAASPLTRLLMD